LTIYADTSFLVALYLRDSHTPSALEFMKARPRLPFTELHFAECCHAVARQVFYGKVSEADAQVMYHHMRNDLITGVWIENAIPENAVALCADLARRHGPKLGARTLDSLHVACALELKAERFWTFDERQAKLAKAEGLKG
jgi:predicted nucleic acid-binding protein